MTILITPTDARIRQNGTLNFEHTAKDVDGNTIDISGLTGTALLWRLATAKGAVNTLEKSIGSGITFVDALNGVFQVSITKTESLALTANQVYYWETWATIGLDEVLIAWGYLQVLPRIT